MKLMENRPLVRIPHRFHGIVYPGSAGAGCPRT